MSYLVIYKDTAKNRQTNKTPLSDLEDTICFGIIDRTQDNTYRDDDIVSFPNGRSNILLLF